MGAKTDCLKELYSHHDGQLDFWPVRTNGLTVVCETKRNETKRNEMERNKMKICSLRNENLQFAKFGFLAQLQEQ